MMTYQRKDSRLRHSFAQLLLIHTKNQCRHITGKATHVHNEYVQIKSGMQLTQLHERQAAAQQEIYNKR